MSDRSEVSLIKFNLSNDIRCRIVDLADWQGGGENSSSCTMHQKKICFLRQLDYNRLQSYVSMIVWARRTAFEHCGRERSTIEDRQKRRSDSAAAEGKRCKYGISLGNGGESKETKWLTSPFGSGFCAQLLRIAPSTSIFLCFQLHFCMHA